ncbi:MAG: DUF503 domain-containing protein [Chloroflexi bacterium]|nr:DUF503 domain-containing protein [Chloroflexota bacterium]MDA1146743.1 DUF503 domain-containing protein [Chloroflexota bacterium]MQC82888.1 DUF503 domain-containing protein [Chloroflexota bacterium]
MTTVSVLLTLHLLQPGSLKDKRAVVRSLVERLRKRLDVSAAEVGLQDDTRRAQIGFATVSGSPSVARGLADDALRFAERELIGRAEIVDATRDEQTIVS